MIENFQATIGANIREFTSRMREVDSTIRNAATGAEVDITADIVEFQRHSQQVANEVRALERDPIQIPVDIQTDSATRQLRALQREIRSMQNEMKLANERAMYPFRINMLQTEHNMFKLAQSMGSFNGSTKDFMSQVQQLGADYKKASDAMINANRMIGVSIIQTAGQMMNMSTQANKISANFERMANPLYNVNRAGLAVADSLNQMANRGNAAVLALRMLGPNASMKQLNDMVMMINQGLMRFNMVAMGAAITSALLYGALHKAAMQNEEYANSFNTMLATIRQAFQPMVDVFTSVMTKVYDFVTAIGQMAIKFNEAHPTLAKIIQGIMMLIPALTLLLSPLAIGIGLFGGLAAAWSSLWMLIGPLVTGLAAMSATVWIVAAAIVGLVAGITYLWNTNEGFRNAVITAWNNIKETAMTVWNAILPVIQTAFQAIVTLVQAKLAEMKAFWDQYGAQIMQTVQNAWSVITSIFQAAMAVLAPIVKVGWAVIKSIIQSTWEAIKNVINGALAIIQGIIKVFSGLFTGDFKLMWEGIKQLFTGALQFIWGLVNLYFVSKLIGPLKTFASSAKTLIQTIWTTIKGIFTNALNAIKSSITTAFNTIKSSISQALNSIKASIQSAFSTARSIVDNAVQAIKSVVSSVFNALKGIVTDSMNGVKSAIQNGWNAAKSFLSSINLASIGKQIIQGLINGIKSMAGAVGSAISSIASNIKGKIQSALGIHSPSRWMRDMVGKNIVSGVIVGMNKMENKAYKASASMSEWFTPSLSDVSYAGFDIGTQMDELKNQIKQDLDVDLWVHQAQLMKSQQSNGSGGDLVLEVDGFELARIQRQHLDDMNVGNYQISLVTKGLSI